MKSCLPRSIAFVLALICAPSLFAQKTDKASADITADILDANGRDWMEHFTDTERNIYVLGLMTGVHMVTTQYPSEGARIVFTPDVSVGEVSSTMTLILSNHSRLYSAPLAAVYIQACQITKGHRLLEQARKALAAVAKSRGMYVNP